MFNSSVRDIIWLNEGREDGIIWADPWSISDWIYIDSIGWLCPIISIRCGSLLPYCLNQCKRRNEFFQLQEISILSVMLIPSTKNRSSYFFFRTKLIGDFEQHLS